MEHETAAENDGLIETEYVYIVWDESTCDEQSRF